MPRDATEFSGFLNATGLSFTLAVTKVVAAGNTVVVSVCSSSTVTTGNPLVATASDTRGNTWFKGLEHVTATSGSYHQFRSKIAAGKDLQIGDVITITFATNATRAVGVAGIYSEDLNGADGAAAQNDSGAATSSALSSGNFTTSHAGDGLLVGTVGLVSAARIFTPTSPWLVGTKFVSTSGSGDRGVQQIYRYVTAPGTFNAQGNLNSSSLWGLGAIGLKYTDPPAGRSGRLWWNGAPKPTLYNGVEKFWSYNGVLSK